MVMPRIGHGTFLQVGDGAGPEVFTTIAKLTEVGEFGGDVDDIDITNHDNAEAVREYTRGLAEPGEITFTGIWVLHATQLEAFAEVFAGLGPNRNFKIILPDSMGVALFNGYFAGFRLNPAIDAAITFSGRIKISGDFTLAAP